MTRILFSYACAACPGDGVIRGQRAGVDWPTPCACKARSVFSQYELGRILEVSPKTLVRLHLLTARPSTAARVLEKLALHGFLPGARVETRRRGRKLPPEPRPR